MGGKRRIYLDHNASSPVRPAAADAVVRGLSLSGNPSSIHGEGRAARAFLEAARTQVAEAVGARARDVVFTSGATEGLNALLRPALLPATGPERLTHLFLGATEHAAVRDGHDFGAEWTQTIPVDGNGLIDCAALDAQLAALRGNALFAPVLVAIQAANNETGVLQPLDAIARIANAHGAVLVVDAVQAIGKLPFDLAATGIAAIVLSAHKFGGPKGVGAIVLNGDRVRLERPLIAGGGQETRRRSGTENIAGIGGMAAALTEAAATQAAEAGRLSALRDSIEARILAVVPDAIVFGRDAPRLPNTTLLAVPGLKAEMLLMAFDLAGAALSSGSACSSGKVARSHVLDAMGIAPDVAEGALRISLGWTTTSDDAAMFADMAQTTFKSLLQRKHQRAA